MIYADVAHRLVGHGAAARLLEQLDGRSRRSLDVQSGRGMHLIAAACGRVRERAPGGPVFGRFIQRGKMLQRPGRR